MFDKKPREEKEAEQAIKKGIKLYMADALSTMQHTQGCGVCAEKFDKIVAHAGSPMKSVTHIPNCAACQELFKEIVAHTKTPELENKQDVSI